MYAQGCLTLMPSKKTRDDIGCCRLQVALQLSDPQAEAICDAYEAMSNALNDVYSEQRAMISSISQPRQHELLGDQVSVSAFLSLF